MASSKQFVPVPRGPSPERRSGLADRSKWQAPGVPARGANEAGYGKSEGRESDRNERSE